MIEKTGLLQSSKLSSDFQGGAVQISGKFAESLEQAIEELNTQEHKVNQLTEQFSKGELTDVHQLMIESQKALLGLELTVQIRDKAVEAYQEMMRLQV